MMDHGSTFSSSDSQASTLMAFPQHPLHSEAWLWTEQPGAIISHCQGITIEHLKRNKVCSRAFQIIPLNFNRNDASAGRYSIIKIPPEKYMFSEIIHFNRLLLHSKSLISFLFTKSPKTFPYRFKRLTWHGSLKKESTFLMQSSLI